VFAFVLVMAGPWHKASAQGVFAERWMVRRSGHFTLYTHAAVEPLADDVLAMCEAAHDALAPLLGEPPHRTHVVLTDAVDGANGSATVVPLQILRLQAMPPEASSTLGYFDNWMWNLIVHEYTHILHLSTMSPAFLWANVPFGRRLAPNQQLPRWLIEGLATWQESEQTGTGRVNSPFFEAWLRIAVWDDEVPGPGALNGVPTTWPQGNGWYLFGAYFVDWAAREYGTGAWVEFIRRYGDRLVPFGINLVSAEVFGEDMPTLWALWLDAKREEYASRHAALVDAGLDTPLVVTPLGYQHRYVTASRDGRCVAWIRDDSFQQVGITEDCEEPASSPTARWGRAAVAGFDDHGPLPTELTENDGEFDYSPDGSFLVVSQQVGWRNGYTFRDLFRFDRATGAWERLTEAGRAREPRVSPDGRRVVYVRPSAGRTDLWVLDLTTGESALFAAAEPWGQFSRPFWLPDGSGVVASYLQPGRGRDIVEIASLSPEFARWRWLTSDAAFDLDPWVSADGHDVVFSSDRGGIHDIWAVSRLDGSLRRLTRTWGGVFSPALVERSDGRWLWVSSYGSDGFHVARIPIDEVRWRAGLAPGEVEAAPLRPLAEFPAMDGQARRMRSALRVRPLQWMPGVSVAQDDVVAGVTFTAGDPPGIHSILGTLQYSTGFMHPVWAVDVNTQALPVGLGISTTGRTIRRTDVLQTGGVFRESIQQEITINAGFSVPFPVLGSSHSVSFGYSWQRFGPIRLPSADLRPEDPTPVFPRAQRYDSVAASWDWSDLTGTVQGISTERGTALGSTLRARSRVWGSDIESGEFSWYANQYIPMPWALRHVVAIRATGALGSTRFAGRRLYGIGGIPPQDLVTALVDALPAGTVHVRGYPVNAHVGDRFWLTSVEYRFPLANLNTGYGTFPLFLQRLHGAAFVDLGDAYDGPWRVRGTLAGAGMELRLSAVFGYFEGASFRLGAARGLTREGAWNAWFLYGFQY
jgi:hypothetical protein